MRFGPRQGARPVGQPGTGQRLVRDALTEKSVSMGLFQVIHPSRLFGFDTGIPSKILLDARRLNARDDRTGALICRADIYLQLLEGPEATVRQTMERIKRDDRHLEVVMHVEAMVPERMFGA